MCPASGRFIWAISVIGRSNGLVCSRRILRMRSHAPFESIVTKFCMWGRLGDVITDAKFL